MCRITLQQDDANALGIKLDVVRKGTYDEIEKCAELAASLEHEWEQKQTQARLQELCSKSLIATLPNYPRSFTCEQLDGTLVLNAGADSDFIDHIERLENAYGISAQFDF